MSSKRRKCCNDPNVFCYICGDYTVKKQRKPITDFVKRAYYAYFGIKLGDQDKSCSPHIVCKTCIEILRMLTNGKNKNMKFGIPMVWREPKNHSDDCYFCTVNMKGFNRFKKSNWFYSWNLPEDQFFTAMTFRCLHSLIYQNFNLINLKTG